MLSFAHPLVYLITINYNLIVKVLYTITYKSRLTPKKWHKKTNTKTDSIYRTNGIITWHFFYKFSLWPFKVVEVKWQLMLNFALLTRVQWNMKYTKSKKIRTVEQFVIQRFTLPFRGEEPNFQEQLQNFEVAILLCNFFGLAWKSRL